MENFEHEPLPVFYTISLGQVPRRRLTAARGADIFMHKRGHLALGHRRVLEINYSGAKF